MNGTPAQIFDILPGIELLYGGKDGVTQLCIPKTDLCNNSDSMIFSICMENDFCFILLPGKKMPTFFSRYVCDMSIVLNSPLIKSDDFQWLPSINTIITEISKKFCKEEQFCMIKVTPEMKEVFAEMLEVPIPPNRFRFYMQLKVVELLILLSNFNVYNSGIHFYPYYVP